jgi:hypothetical protein
MSFLDVLKQNNTISNTKDGEYYGTTWNANLDVFAGLSRYQDTDEIIKKYKLAFAEDQTLALANLLYILDIRGGKGERLLFKTIFEYLCKNERDSALKILPFISELGRWDYVLEGLNTTIDEEVVSLIKEQLEKDKNSDAPSLLAKWLPSHRTHNVPSEMAKILIKKLNITEEEYRKTLSLIRKKLSLVETKLTEKEYTEIDFEKVPTKAMLKYRQAFNNHCKDAYSLYLEQVAKGEKKINTTGLYCYEIIRNIVFGNIQDEKLLDNMWNNQKDILNGYDKNILVMADTSGSMTEYGCIPYANSIGLATYIAERNNGIFKNHFITFSENPVLQEIRGNTIVEKVNNFVCEVANTHIDKAFELVLNTAKDNNIGKEEMPSHIIIISDMEFDQGIYSKTGTNFSGWKKAFDEAGYDLPKIIFWNVACNTNGFPATKYDNDVIMISGFSPALLDNLLDLEKFTPTNAMLSTLEKYIKLL